MLVSQTLKYGKNSRLICVVILTSLLFSTRSDELSKARPYVLTTATTGGTFYPVGVAIATIAHAQLAESDGISMTAISSAGSWKTSSCFGITRLSSQSCRARSGRGPGMARVRLVHLSRICAASVHYGKR